MNIVAQLAAITGAEHVQENGVISIAPANSAELSEIVRVAAGVKAALVPVGGGTRRTMGLPLVALDRPVVEIRTTRLNQVIEYVPEDMTISVGSGMTMAALQAAVAVNGQMLPIDVPLPGRSTIGGILACAADGPRRLGYGTVRDLFLGTAVVEARGRGSKAGGMTVKNVSGFDMMKLYIGSLGSLAIITSANFKLLPIPRAAATIACEFETLGAAFALVDALATSKLVPVACEVVRAEGGQGFGLCVAAEGLPQSVERHRRDVAAFARTAGASGVDLLEGAEHTAFWARIQDLPQAADVAADEIVVRVGTLPSAFGAALESATKLAVKHGVSLQFSGRALNGLGYLRARGAGWKAFHAELLTALPQAAIVVLGLGSPDPGVNMWGRPPAGLDLMRRIKHEFDPENALNPGRYLV